MLCCTRVLSALFSVKLSELVTGSSGSNSEHVDYEIYLFCLTNRGRCIQCLVLEIWGGMFVLEEEWWRIASKRWDMSRCLSTGYHARPFLLSLFVQGKVT